MSGRWHRPTVDNVFGPCDDAARGDARNATKSATS